MFHLGRNLLIYDSTNKPSKPFNNTLVSFVIVLFNKCIIIFELLILKSVNLLFNIQFYINLLSITMYNVDSVNSLELTHLFFFLLLE